MEALLRLKHWQIFMMTVAVPIFIAIIQILHLVMFPVMGEVLGWISLIAEIITQVWFYSVGIILNQRRPEEKQSNTDVFKFAIFGSIALQLLPYIQLVLPFEWQFAFGFTNLIVSFCLGVYIIWFVTTILEAVDYTGRMVSTFFSILFFPIGIWWIQPRLNMIMEQAGLGETSVDRDAPLDDHLR